eukprot:gene4236-8488_t
MDVQSSESTVIEMKNAISDCNLEEVVESTVEDSSSSAIPTGGGDHQQAFHHHDGSVDGTHSLGKHYPRVSTANFYPPSSQSTNVTLPNSSRRSDRERRLSWSFMSKLRVGFNRKRIFITLTLILAIIFVIYSRGDDSEINKTSRKAHRDLPKYLQLTESGCPEFKFGANVSFTRRGRKILISSGAYNNVVDGVSKTLNRLVADLQQRDFQIVVIAPTGDIAAMEHQGLLYPAPSVSVPFRPEYRLALGLDSCTRRMFEEFKPDIVHIATPDLLGHQVQRWALDHGIPVVCSYHTRFNSYLPYYLGTNQLLSPVDSALWAWMRIFYGKCEHTYPPTPSVVEELKEHGVKTQLRLWPRGIDLTTFNTNRRSSKLRAQWGANNNTTVVLTVCRLVWEKNLQEIIDTLKLMEDHHENFRAVVVGDGPARPTMQEQLPNTIFTGFLNGLNLSTAFASADIFFFPSLTETWGAVTLEAMASGLPVIVADAPGSKELVENGKTGYIIEPGRPHRWANAITELIYKSEHRKQLGANALEVVTATSSLTWKHATDMLVAHYLDILDPKQRYAEFYSVPVAEPSQPSSLTFEQQ